MSDIVSLTRYPVSILPFWPDRQPTSEMLSHPAAVTSGWGEQRGSAALKEPTDHPSEMNSGNALFTRPIPADDAVWPRSPLLPSLPPFPCFGTDLLP